MATIRTARPGEENALTELALAAKGHWGYDRAFLDACRAELTVRAADLPRIRVADVDGRPIGWCSVTGEPPEGELDNLWVHPSAIGTGAGRLLWERAVADARARGLTRLRIEADPGAEGFYRSRGAERAGDVASGSVPGRRLPLLRYTVPRPS